MGVDIELSGLGDMMDELERMAVNVAAIENEALQAAAGPILEEAKKTSAFHDRSEQGEAFAGNAEIETGHYWQIDVWRLPTDTSTVLLSEIKEQVKAVLKQSVSVALLRSLYLKRTQK